MSKRHVAVIDIGKTNAKLALVNLANLSEIAVVTRPNKVLPGPPWPHFDTEGHWEFLLHSLAFFHAVTPDKMQPPIILDADSASVEVPRGYPGDASRLVMDDSGLAVVKWPMPETGAHAFPYLFIHLQGPSLPQSLTVFWKQAATGEHLHRFRVPGRPQMLERLPISGAESWHGAITELGLVMQGDP